MYYALSFVAGGAVATAGCWFYLVHAMKEVDMVLDEAQEVAASNLGIVVEDPAVAGQLRCPT